MQSTEHIARAEQMERLAALAGSADDRAEYLRLASLWRRLAEIDTRVAREPRSFDEG